ncbi:diphosphomevalonate decarboxylase [Streptohalobacillus salinus]|uniref:diphosphomevalonate decarboxylase n=1 Tax=Streptohalobacillus salinus TaxID=621096 RepID=A0A2V3WQC9_9BACI|nr:diphosphomevalonate decarboxylase [Streptohalobacillus salinus]PXW90909.1 diphosphomevalonate decarboxylase [Streptohalobacillus salinus]
MKKTARAHTNIALIKYWGKRDEQLFLPTNSSLSITLDRFYTETSVEFDANLTADRFRLDHAVIEGKEREKVQHFLDKVRRATGETRFAHVESVNHVPTAAGFASSASGYSALAAAAIKAAGQTFTEKELSILARQGSGSASRSVYGGFVEWQKGQLPDGSDSHAIPILNQDEFDLAVLSVEVTTEKKKVLSREGMKRTVETSPFYEGWLKTVDRDLAAIKTAIHARDFRSMGEILEYNALKMHATTLGADPPFMYWQSATLKVMEAVSQLREEGLLAYFTIDAGPNVKVIVEIENEQAVIERLNQIDVVSEIYPCRVGPGITYLD